MLENYKDGQPIFYNITTNAILNNKISHAYIFDSNGNSLVMEMVMSFVKQIICMDIKQDDIKENIFSISSLNFIIFYFYGWIFCETICNWKISECFEC